MGDLLAERDGAFGAAADATLLARLGLKLGDRVTVGSATLRDPQRGRRRARQARRRRRLRPALPGQRSRRCAPPDCCSPAAWCAGSTACGCPTTRPTTARDHALIDEARTRVAAGRLGNPQPRQRLAAARAHHQPLHPVSHPGRPRRAAGRRRRRRQCREEPYRPPPRRDRLVQGARRHRPRRVRDLSDPGDGAGRDRIGDRACARRGAALRHRRPVRQAAAAAGGAGAASGRTGAVVRLRPAHRARLRAVAAGRVHDVPVAALFREAAPANGIARAALSRADGGGDRAADRGGGRAGLRQARRDRLRGVIDRGVRAAARDRRRR